MNDFSKILDKAKELETKMKESQQKIKEIRVEGRDIEVQNGLKIPHKIVELINSDKVKYYD